MITRVQIKPVGMPADYWALARPSHWIKHVFIVPGVVLAYLLRPSPLSDLLPTVVTGFLSAATIASANYVLNEWLDAEFDAHRSPKSTRPAVVKQLSPTLVWLEYMSLAAVGLFLAARLSKALFIVSVAFLISGVVYNVRPLRTKDTVFLDVLSESINNPIRLTLGWVMVDPTTLPPGSALLAYWMGGAYLMALKRLAEYRSAAGTGDFASLAKYRRSFGFYTERSLLLSGFLYALLSAFFLGIFLVKYRIEYILSVPIFVALFVTYLNIALEMESAAQAPETLYRERLLMAWIVLLGLALALLTWIDIPILHALTSPHYLSFGGAP